MSKKEESSGSGSLPSFGLNTLASNSGENNEGELRIVERVIECDIGGDGQWMQLTHANYSD